MPLPKLTQADKCFPNLDGSGDWSIKGYQQRGGYKGLKELLKPRSWNISKNSSNPGSAAVAAPASPRA